MNISSAERHQIENEMLFRRMNEKVGDDLGALDASYIEDKEIYLIRDENCSVRIPLRLSEYQDIHENRDTFIVMPDHQVDPIEKVVSSGPKYNIVVKNNSTPAPAKGKQLNDTSIDNSRIDG
jgi:hypothetical protein